MPTSQADVQVRVPSVLSAEAVAPGERCGTRSPVSRSLGRCEVALGSSMRSFAFL